MAEPTLSLSVTSLRTAGFLLLSLLAVEFGGYSLIALSTGAREATQFQESFSRAGHAHAGVLVILALVALLLADATRLRSPWSWVARLAIPVAAVLMPAGFFLSAVGAGREQPNALIALVYLGALSLAVGVTVLGVGLIRTRGTAPVAPDPAPDPALR